MTSIPPDADLPAQFAAAAALFAPIRARFDRPGAERGGCVRAGVTPVYVRKFGAHAATIFPGLDTVEASFTPEQLRAVTATTLALKGAITAPPAPGALATCIIARYHAGTAPAFVPALLQASEDVLGTFIAANPAHAPVLDAIFRVAGGEGFRDLIRLYAAPALEHALAGTTPPFPDILAFVNLHERPVRSASGTWQETRYEVWCPGYDLAKEYQQQCVLAAQALVAQHGVGHALPRSEDLARLPLDLVAHLTAFVRERTTRVVERVTSRAPGQP